MAKGGRGKCLACASEKREEIDSALIAGEPSRRLAERFGISATSLRAHKRDHVSPALAKIRERHIEKTGARLLDRFEAMAATTAEILKVALEARNPTAALAAIREQRGVLETIGRLTGELKERPTVSVNVANSPEWVAMRAKVVESVPVEYRAQLAERLMALDS